MEIDLNNYLPGSRHGRTIRERVFTANIELTGRCNVNCSYCHFYATRERKSVAYDMGDDQFFAYMSFMKYWKENIKGITNFRFSGGDPIVMKDKLFVRANQAYNITGIKPFVLTHGKGLNEKFVAQAQKSAISQIYVSIENHISPDDGAIDPWKSIENVKKLNSNALPIILGVCVIPVSAYKYLLEICDWFYDQIGYIPPIAEINYDLYVPPTEAEWCSLQENLELVIKKYYGKTHLNLFHSVSPELGYNGSDPYVFSLDLTNKYRISSENYREKIIEVLNELEKRNYPALSCRNTNCDWWEFCDNTKWYWQGDKQNTRESKLQDYCRLKRMINDTYYRLIVDDRHLPNKIGIFEGENQSKFVKN